MELVSEPSLLFLDEPTTGLDSSTALAVVRLLRELGKTKTIVMSIHQPSSRIWDSFDRVLLMNKGKVIFHGTKHEALIWAAKEGHEAEEFENPADHLMDVIQQYGDEMRPFVSEDGGFEEINLNSGLNSMERTVSPVLKTGMVSKLDQFKALSWRSQIVLKREPALLRVSIGSSIFFGLFIGFLFYRMDLDDCLPSGLKTILVPNQNRIGAIFFVLVNLWQSALMYVDVFTESGMVFKREFVAGYYSVGPYLAAIYMFQVLPSRLMPAIIYSCTSYWMAGFVRMAGPFFMFMLMLIAVSVSSGCALLSFSVITTQPMVGQMFFIFFTMVFLLTTGFMPALPSLTWAVQWIKYISIHRYLLEGLTVNEYIHLGAGKNDSYVENGVKYICDYSAKREFTKKFLSIPSMDYSIYWRNVGIIMGLCVAFMVMSYAGLVMRTKRNV